MESLDLRAGLGLQQLQDPFGSMGQTLPPADRLLSVSGVHQGLDIAADLEMYELESVALTGMQSMIGFERRDTVETGGTAGPGSRVEPGCRAAAAADAVAGCAESVMEVWAVPPPETVLAEGWAAEAGQWVWLGGTESESAVGSWSEVLSCQCQELFASDSSDTATPGPVDTKQRFQVCFIFLLEVQKYLVRTLS